MTDSSESIRLNKYIATNFGVSRREADILIKNHDVLINNEYADIGARVHDGDKVLVKGKAVPTTDKIYLALHKPAGYVCSRRKQGDTDTIYSLLPTEYQSLKNVGRLDKDSSGVVLLTNDGDFAYRMTHPKFQKTKIYEVEIDRDLASLHQQMIADFGVTLNDGISKLGLMRLSDNNRREWQVWMSEGRNRQIRRTFDALGYRVIKLHRTNFGPYSIDGLESGKWRKITI